MIAEIIKQINYWKYGVNQTSRQLDTDEPNFSHRQFI